MAFKTVSNLKDGVAGILTGINLNNVTNLNEALARAVRVMGNRIDVPEASGRQSFMLYDGVYDYAAPSTIFGSALNDLRPQGIARTLYDENYKQPISLFDRTKALLPNGYKVTFEYDQGVGIMRVASPNVTPKVLLDPMNATTGWTASGNASSLALDSTVYYQSPGALRFNLAASGTQGLVTKTLTSTLSLTPYQGVGVVFLAVYIPNAAALATITNFALRFGSSSANYYEVTATVGQLGAFVSGKYILVPFDLSTATTPGGTPSITAMNYIRIATNYTGTAVTNLRFGNLFIALPQPHEVLFQSPAIFQTSGSNPSSSITNDNDSVLLNDAAYVIYEHECAMAIAIQASKTTAQAVISPILHGVRARNGMMVTPGLYDMYEANNPSGQLRTIGSYYDGADYNF